MGSEGEQEEKEEGKATSVAVYYKKGGENSQVEISFFVLFLGRQMLKN